MNRLLSILVLIFCGACVHSQDITKFYKQSIHSEGFLYFVYPQKMSQKKSESGNISKKDLSYDYTYLDSKDSVTILMTLTTSMPYRPDSVDIKYNSGNQENSISAKAEILYVESQKKYWKTRVRATVGYGEWADIYECPTPMTVSFSSDKDKQKIEFMDSQKKWKKLSMKFVRLFQVINYNK